MMLTTISVPEEIDKNLLDKVVALIVGGEQVKPQHVKRGIERASLVAIFTVKGEVVSSATLKYPLKSYKEKVFKLANCENLQADMNFELGYIVTNPKYEGQKHCQSLLSEFFQVFGKEKFFATTRKPSMVHILTKLGFKKVGNQYNSDLHLLIYDLERKDSI